MEFSSNCPWNTLEGVTTYLGCSLHIIFKTETDVMQCVQDGRVDQCLQFMEMTHLSECYNVGWQRWTLWSRTMIIVDVNKPPAYATDSFFLLQNALLLMWQTIRPHYCCRPFCLSVCLSARLSVTLVSHAYKRLSLSQYISATRYSDAASSFFTPNFILVSLGV